MANIVVEGRVLQHSRTRGVERYVSEMCRLLPEVAPQHRFRIVRPLRGTRLAQHIWEHCILPISCMTEKADLLFCPANIAPAFMPARVKFVVTLHGLAFRYSPESYSRAFFSYYSILTPLLLKKTEGLIAVSMAEKRSILAQYDWVDESKIHVVPSGINKRMFNCTHRDKAKEVLERGYEIRGDFVLAVGSFAPVKNFARLIQAFSIIKCRIETGLVLICGTAGIFRSDAASIQNNSRIKIIDDVGADLVRFYQAATLLVFPSLYEGFGFPPLEAMACGCPVVVSNVAALPEVCGDAAYYVDPNDTHSIAAGIERVSTDESLRQSLIKRGLRRARDFTWEKTAQETLKVFDQVLAETSAGR